MELEKYYFELEPRPEIMSFLIFDFYLQIPRSNYIIWNKHRNHRNKSK